MELNGITCKGYQQIGNTVSFLLDCDFDTAIAIDGTKLTVTADGEDVAVFGGYELTGVERETEGTRARYAMALEANVEAAYKAVAENYTITKKAADKAETSAASAQSTATSALNQATDLSSQLEAYGQAIEELATQVLV